MIVFFEWTQMIWIIYPFSIHCLDHFISVKYNDICLITFNQNYFEKLFGCSELGDYSFHNFILSVDDWYFHSNGPTFIELLTYYLLIYLILSPSVEHLETYIIFLKKIVSNSNKGKIQYFNVRSHNSSRSLLRSRPTSIVNNQFHIFIIKEVL